VAGVLTFITVAIWFWYLRWRSAATKRDEENGKMDELFEGGEGGRDLRNIIGRKVGRA
jgi:hypothetical protein